jgi:hypothetical protein
MFSIAASLATPRSNPITSEIDKMYILSYTTVDNTDYWQTFDQLTQAQTAMELTLQVPDVTTANISVAIISTEPQHVEVTDLDDRLCAVRAALSDWRADRDTSDYDPVWDKIQGAMKSLELALEHTK